MSLYKTIGESKPEYLLDDPQGADVIAIPLEPGNGVVKRGTVLYRKESGMYAPAASTNVTAANMLVVLDESVDTDANASVAEDARAYRAGRLIAGRVFLAGDAAITAAHKAVLRGQSIVFNQMNGAADFENSKTAITYKANGGTGDDTVVYADAGAAYTIAVSSFTAPSGKTFSKWNTKPDGTGTNYAASASYTANADLTLYAIWA